MYDIALKERQFMYLFLQVVAIVSCLFVVVSTLCLIFSTLPAFQVKDEEGNISRKLEIIGLLVLCPFFSLIS